MKFVDRLRKLGVLRFGATSGVYHNAKDRPVELMDDEVYNAQKDGVTHKEAAKALQPAALSKQLFIASLLAAILFVLFALTSKLWWLVWMVWLLWVVLLWLIRSGKLKLRLPFAVVFAALVFFSFVGIVFTQSETSQSNSGPASSSAGSSTRLTAAQCQPYVQKYNNKVYKLKADGLQGTLAFKIDTTNGCELKYWYNTLISYELPQNSYVRDEGRIAYYYTMMLRRPDQSTRTKDDGVGALSVVRKNQTTPPAPYDDIMERSKLYIGDTPPALTQHFSWGYMSVKNFSEYAVKELLAKTKLEIVDGLPYIEERSSTVGGQTTASWSINTDKAIPEGQIVKTYNLEIVE